jgi:hypothetical protein
MSKTYVLTPTEADIYDNGDDEQVNRLLIDLRKRFGPIAGGLPVETEVLHPEGFLIEQFAKRGE